MFLRFLALLILPFSLLLPPLSGAEAGSLDDAIEAWLADKDEVALPALTALAKQGDVRAQLLLGKIAKRPFSPYLEALPRKQRLALIRAPGGLSGRSWLKIAAENGSTLAAAFLGVSMPPYASRDIATLLHNGEDDAAVTTLRRATLYGKIEGSKMLVTRQAFPADAAYTAHVFEIFSGKATSSTSSEPGDDPLQIIESLAVGAWFGRRPLESPARDMSFYLFPGEERGGKPAPVGDLLLKLAPLSRPAQRVVSYCHAACPGMIMKSCIGDALTLAGGYDALWQLGPPCTVIDQRKALSRKPAFPRRLRASPEHSDEHLAAGTSGRLVRTLLCRRVPAAD